MNLQSLQGFLLCALLTVGMPALAHQGEDHDEPETGAPLILGVLDFPNSGAEAAQDGFTRGVLLLHSFEFRDAREAFVEAQAIDPGFAMAIWGEAMTLNHPLWAEQDRASERQILKNPRCGGLFNIWRPLGDSNPCCRRERAVS